MSRKNSTALTLLRENPTVIGGIVAFGCMFALIAGNAIYAQPGQHPDPIWNTRDAVTTQSIPGQNYNGVQYNNVKANTRPSATMASVISIPVPEQRPAIARPATQQNDAVAKVDGAAKRKLLKQMQTRLAQLGLYEGKVDGLYGPATRRAIEMFQVNAGLDKTGVPSPSLLFSINQTIGLIDPTGKIKESSMMAVPEKQKAPAETTPVAKPAAKPQIREASVNTIEEKIQMASRRTSAKPVVETPAPVPAPTPAKTIAVSENEVEADLDDITTQGFEAATNEVATPAPAPEPKHDFGQDLIRLAQKGLTVFGVSGIEPNGRLTPKTVDALVRFQERYQLATTGQPDKATIKKMIDIGALKRG